MVQAQRNSGRLPSVFVAGFPKCGTTSLHATLCGHLDIHRAVWRDETINDRRYNPKKELYFFSDGGLYSMGLDWYKQHFRADRKHAIDGTPTYVADEIALDRIQIDCPDAKFIIVLRDPVYRAYSAWNHWNQLEERWRWPMADPLGSFERNLEIELLSLNDADPKEGFIGHGMYHVHLERLFQRFPRENVLIVFSVDLRFGFRKEIFKIFEFLGVDKLDVPRRDANVRDYSVSPLSADTYEFLRGIFSRHDEMLEELLGRRLPWEWR